MHLESHQCPFPLFRCYRSLLNAHTQCITKYTKRGFYHLTGADPGILERGPGKGAKPRTERRRRERRQGVWGASPIKFWKIRCDFLQSGIYFWDQNGLGYHSKLGLCWTKNSSGHDFDSHTHAYTLTPPKTPRISATIKSKFNFNNIFSDIVYNVKNKLTLPKMEGAPPLDPPLLNVSFFKTMHDRVTWDKQRQLNGVWGEHIPARCRCFATVTLR